MAVPCLVLHGLLPLLALLALLPLASAFLLLQLEVLHDPDEVIVRVLVVVGLAERILVSLELHRALLSVPLTAVRHEVDLKSLRRPIPINLRQQLCFLLNGGHVGGASGYPEGRHGQARLQMVPRPLFTFILAHLVDFGGRSVHIRRVGSQRRLTGVGLLSRQLHRLLPIFLRSLAGKYTLDFHVIAVNILLLHLFERAEHLTLALVEETALQLLDGRSILRLSLVQQLDLGRVLSRPRDGNVSPAHLAALFETMGRHGVFHYAFTHGVAQH